MRVGVTAVDHSDPYFAALQANGVDSEYERVDFGAHGWVYEPLTLKVTHPGFNAAECVLFALFRTGVAWLRGGGRQR